MGATSRVRMTPEDRRRQLVGIGLRKFVERPVQDLSLDEVAVEAGVSRGLLFHYFPTKTEYHRAVVQAAGRRVARTVSPDPGVTGDAAVRQVVERFLDQVARRRDSYVALVLGQAPIARSVDPDATVSLRTQVAEVVLASTGLAPESFPAVHGWVAYLEDRALEWSATPARSRGTRRAALVDHCTRALGLLTEVAVS
ncbi:TetR/AcrR family transcriptional regulator [Oryzobacter terrae]|uniref:TetR/AcrR family transcriptional regulator n=1 Tax=Oryzobacter terrae TaxID=1620385 RepID=UPI00366D00EC